jgi:RecA/RadA recombinase
LDFLSTGCHGIDRLLGGGLTIHKIAFVYGEAATGKSIFSMQCALEAARREFRVLFLDSDQSFSAHRMERLAGIADLAESIVLFRPEDFEEQSRLVENVENLLTKGRAFLVVDSVTSLYRVGRIKSEESFGRDRELNRQLAQLNALATRFGVWVLLTGQVHSLPSGREWFVTPVATRTLRHWSDTILRLNHTPRTGIRDCVLEKKNGHEASGSHCFFKITENGIEDV